MGGEGGEGEGCGGPGGSGVGVAGQGTPVQVNAVTPFADLGLSVPAAFKLHFASVCAGLNCPMQQLSNTSQAAMQSCACGGGGECARAIVCV